MCNFEKLIEQLDKKAAEMLKLYGVKRTYLSTDLAQLVSEMSSDECADLMMQLIRMKEQFWISRAGESEEAREAVSKLFKRPEVTV